MTRNIAKMLLAMVISCFLVATCMAKDKTIPFVIDHERSNSVGQFPPGSTALLSVTATSVKGFLAQEVNTPGDGISAGERYQGSVMNSFLAPDPTGEYSFLYECFLYGPHMKQALRAVSEARFWVTGSLDSTGKYKKVWVKAACIAKSGNQIAVERKPIYEK